MILLSTFTYHFGRSAAPVLSINAAGPSIFMDWILTIPLAILYAPLIVSNWVWPPLMAPSIKLVIEVASFSSTANPRASLARSNPFRITFVPSRLAEPFNELIRSKELFPVPATSALKETLPVLCNLLEPLNALVSDSRSISFIDVDNVMLTGCAFTSDVRFACPPKTPALRPLTFITPLAIFKSVDGFKKFHEP